MLATYASMFCYYSIAVSLISTKPHSLKYLGHPHTNFQLLGISCFSGGVTTYWYHFFMNNHLQLSHLCLYVFNGTKMCCVSLFMCAKFQRIGLRTLSFMAASASVQQEKNKKNLSKFLKVHI